MTDSTISRLDPHPRSCPVALVCRPHPAASGEKASRVLRTRRLLGDPALLQERQEVPRQNAVFQKPLFPNYVFLQLLPQQKQAVYQSDHVANLLEVVDQQLFEAQLGDILTALDTELEIFLAPQITAGTRVKIKSGPLRGVEGIVERRSGMTLVLLRLDFISQAAAVKIDASELELI